MSLFRKKDLDVILAEAEGTAGPHLRRVLGPFQVTLLGVGAIIGAGIFTMIGEAAVGASSGHAAGPSLVISFLITSFACGLAALCYAELAAMVPISGSAYTYSYATLGELAAWIIGWDLIIEYAIGNVAVAIGWSGYASSLLHATFGVDIPPWLRLDYRTFAARFGGLESAPHVLGVPLVFNLPAVLIVLGITALLVRGVKESSTANAILVLVKLAVLALFIAVGFSYFRGEHLVPFAPSGWRGVQVGAATVFFAYIGFDAVSTVAEETKRPGRDLPIGMLASLGICTAIYVLVTVALMGMMPFGLLRDGISEPLVTGLNYNHAPAWIVSVVSLGAIVAQTAVLLVFQLGQPRIFFAMSRDGLLPPSFGRVHPRFGTPHVTTIWTGVIVAVLSGFCNLDEMANLCNIGTLFAFTVVAAGVIVLRRADPGRHRPFRAPLGEITAGLAIVFCVFLMTGLGWITWVRFGAWLLVGLAIYFAYGRKRSRLAHG